MGAAVVYGSELAAELKETMKQKVDSLKAQGRRIPCLAVILVGDNPASLSYVKGKEKACASVGILSIMHHLPAETSQQQLTDVIQACNQDPAVDGILVQLPLPKGLDENQAILTIDPDKDVDGLHPLNVGRLYLNQPGFVPCTPKGCMALLQKMGCELSGRRAVVLGRSKLVGAPVARLLQNANATVTICHSRTKDIAAVCREADVVVAAIGKAHFVTREFIKPGAYVIDVGINRTADGHLTGDVDFAAVSEVAGAITPVPKGVGPMTICMLLDNTMRAYEQREQSHGLRTE